jgi:16S rRNA (cytosine967-C5)-methyltransferase
MPPVAIEVTPARRAAYAVVRRVLAEGAWADRALHGEARDLSPRDRALAKQLAFGTVQRRLTLDHVIDERTKGRLEPGVRAALQLGLFQLLFLDRVAEHAAIAEAVELAKPSPGHRVVNAVLRRVQREGAQLPSDETLRGAAIRHSHPEWLVAMWTKALGPEEARALLAANNEPSERALRVNPLVDFDLSDVPGRREGDTIVVEGAFDALAHPGYAAGAFTPQSRASQMVAPLVGPRPGERVLDLCAAPGGKATHLAALVGRGGELVAVERNPRRAAALQRVVERLRAGSIVRVQTGDAAEPRDDGPFDAVLVDPPCSGLGTLQGRPDLRWRARPEAIDELAELQLRILATGAAALKPGGALVYCTCTISPAENEQVVERFLAGDARFVLERSAQTLPHRDATDGFFFARLRRAV